MKHLEAFVYFGGCVQIKIRKSCCQISYKLHPSLPSHTRASAKQMPIVKQYHRCLEKNASSVRQLQQEEKAVAIVNIDSLNITVTDIMSLSKDLVTDTKLDVYI